MRSIQEPVIKNDGLHGAETQHHPAFSFIRASRVSGSTNLYDSDFRHQHYVSVTIGRSHRERSYSNDNTYDERELIQVAMSETQWGHFVSSMNSSSTPCTMQRGPMPESTYKYEMIPGLPDPKPVTEKFDREIDAAMQEAINMVRAMRDKLSSSEKPLSKKEQIELARNLDTVSHRITGSAKFVADQFSEHVEKTVDKAKAEFNAYKMNHTLRVGAAVLSGDVIDLPTLQKISDGIST
jgi:hypothetical protein